MNSNKAFPLTKLVNAICLTTLVLSVPACSQENTKKANGSNTTLNDTTNSDATSKQVVGQSTTNDNASDQNDSDQNTTETEGSNSASDGTLADGSSGAMAEGSSQDIEANDEVSSTLNKVLPTINYSSDNLSDTAQKVNQASWQAGTKIDRNLGTKIQALLNWHQHGVGAVDGQWGKNTRKAMQAFQRARGLSSTDTMNEETWQALIQNSQLAQQPVLVNYTLTSDDVNIKTTSIPAGADNKAKLDGMYYESVIEGLAEKFHMNEGYLKALNPSATFKGGETITVYNPGNPNTKAVSKVVADKASQTLYAYDSSGDMVASYPTTVGSTATPSPSGTHQVKVKIHKPNYTYTGKDGEQSILPPGPNNPVGVVWIGLTKPSYGIHGSPDPERISRQASSGCVRLTNWDALALFGTINDDATVEFK